MTKDNIPLTKDKPNKAIDGEERIHIYISEDVQKLLKLCKKQMKARSYNQVIKFFLAKYINEILVVKNPLVDEDRSGKKRKNAK
jgi:hypothetical protein